MRESGYYPPGAEFDPSAPYNQVDVPEKDFNITCSQTLSKTVTVTTNNYIPGASGVDYESDDEGGYCAVGWHDEDDTSDTNWAEEYQFNGYLTPLQMIELLKSYLEKDLKEWKEKDKREPNSWAATQVRKYKALIAQCEDWCNDETEFIEELT